MILKGLAGRQVLLTRPAAQARSSIDVFSNCGASVFVVPLIEIESILPIDANVLGRIDSFDLVIFTSANAVRMLSKQINLRRIHCDVVCVGPSTAQAAQDLGVPARILPEAGSNSTGLVRQLSKDQPLVGKKILFPCSEGARRELPDGLQAVGAELDQLVVYRTVKASFDGMELSRKIEAKMFDALLFYSPSAVKVFADECSDATLKAARHSLIAAVGRTTASALEEVDLDPGVVSPNPDPQTFASAIAQYFDNRQILEE